MKLKISTLAKQAICLTGLTLLTACLQEDAIIDYNTDPSIVKISAQVGESLPTRTNPVGNENRTAFNAGDVIAISNKGTFVNYTLTDQVWTPESGNYLKWSQPTMTFTGYYPVTLGTNDKDFSVPTTQNSLEAIAAADYMTTTQELTHNGFTPISLQFNRKMARVTVVIGSFGDQYTEAQKKVSQLNVYSGASGYQAGVPGGNVTSINPLVNGNGSQGSSYTALVVPTSKKDGMTFIEIVDMLGNTLTVNGIPKFAPGTSYTYTLHVGKDALRISSVTVTDWATGQLIEEDTEEVSFPDRNFMKYLNESYGVSLDANGEIDVTNPDVLAQLQGIKTVDVKNKSIKSLKGLEYLTQLQSLDCSGNLLTSLQLYNHKTLQNIDCSNNQLTTLTLFGLSELTDLNCSHNPLPSISLTDSRKIERINCSHLKLSSIYVPSKDVLQVLDISYNEFTYFDASSFVNLTRLNCSNNAIYTLRLGNHPKLTSLDCSYNVIENLATDGLTALQTLNCGKNQLTALDLTLLISLTNISCFENQLTSLDVSAFKELSVLSCSSNRLTTLDVSDLTQLDLGALYCGNQANDAQNILTLTYGNNAPGTTFNANINPGVNAVEKSK